MSTLPKSSFEPPIPMRMSAYLDQVTNNRISNVSQIDIYRLDQALKQIDARPSNERNALRVELINRFAEYGDSKGWINKKPPSDEDAVSKFVIEKVFGLKNKSSGDRIEDEFKKLIKESIKVGLNSKGKTYFKFIGHLNDLVNAKSPTEALLILGKINLTELGSWIARQRDLPFFVHKLKVVGVTYASRARFIKWVAFAALKMAPVLKGVAYISKIAKVINPYYTAADIFFTSEETANDETEARLTWLLMYEKASCEKMIPWIDTVHSGDKIDWNYRVNPIDTLKRLQHDPKGSGPNSGDAQMSSAPPSSLPLGIMP